MVKVKICGITRRDDALAAVEAGVDALGFIFVPSSPRCVKPGAVRDIISALPPFITPVGVFVDTPRSQVIATIVESGITCLQFHGSETPDDLRGYPINAYKAFRVAPGFDVEQMRAYPGTVFLLDTYHDRFRGGAGKTFDWVIALQAKKQARIILSGGIIPENVADAVRRVAPWAIDVSSGVERSPGIKDALKIRRLISEIRTAEAEADRQ